MKRSISPAIATLLILWGGMVFAGNLKPWFIAPGSLLITEYDGITDDLLSAGLNQEGLEGVAPALSDRPTVAELRRLSIYNNYRGIVDPIAAGGMGLLWGPKSMDAPSFDLPIVPGLIPGVEYKAYFRARGGRGNLNNIPMVVQIPRHFDPDNPCIVSAPPSGSRGYYGGIAAGEWGLFKGCAVALGGKGSGTGFHLLGENHEDFAIDDTDGVYGSVEEIGKNAQFRVKNSRKLQNFLANHPDRVATAHAHSQINPEARWGRFALNSIRFAFWALNDRFENRGMKRFRSSNTMVIASGVSNGAGVSIRSLEEDHSRLIDGLVVSEPSSNPRKSPFVIKFGDRVFDPNGLSLNDGITLMGTYASCAVLAPSLAETPFYNCEPQLPAMPTAANFENRCRSLHELGLLTNSTLEEQAEEALGILRKNGFYEEENWGIASHECLNLWRTLQPTYAGSYGRFAVWENICNVSFAATDSTGEPMDVPEAIARTLFATSSGIPATAGINLIADDALNGPILENIARSSSTDRADLNLEGALCFRFLSTGDPGILPRSVMVKDILNHLRVRSGKRQLQTKGKLHGRPAIIIHGREDALVFPNYQSRAYYALNQTVVGARSRLRYWEVTPAQHFDTFISTLWPLRPDFTSGPVAFVPLHFYLIEGLDMMYDHLKSGAPLPPSQVVRATPRGTKPYTEDNFETLFPLPVSNPGSDAITFDNGILNIPK